MKHKAIKQQYKDSDGLWIELADCFINRDGGKYIHCETIKEAREELKLIKKVYTADQLSKELYALKTSCDIADAEAERLRHELRESNKRLNKLLKALKKTNK